MVRIELERAGLASRVPAGAVITGGGAETAGILDSAKKTLSLPVRIGGPTGLKGLIDDVVSPAFATPAGLVLYGAGNETQGPLAGFSKRIKLPSGGIVGKFVGIVKDLLP
jgi:cell division protein FtsA